MHNFRKAIFSSLLWLIIVAAISMGLIVPYLQDSSNYYNNEKIKGSIDTVFCGSSQGKDSFIPKIANDRLGISSYNISVVSNSIKGRKALIESEKQQNNIHTVMIEVSADTLYRDNINVEGSIKVLANMHTKKERLEYALNNLSFPDYEYCYRTYLYSGFVNAGRTIFSLRDDEREELGFSPQPVGNMKLSDDAVISSYNSIVLDTNDIPKETYIDLADLFSYCANNFDRTIVIVVPVSNARIWSVDGFDKSFEIVKEMASKYSIDYYDMNLVKNRYSLYNDETSFMDNFHLSRKGAEVFTNSLCDVLQDNLSSISFFSSYDELKENSPYQIIMDRLLNQNDKT